MISVRASFALVALTSIVALGCGPGTPKGVIVKGKVIKGGQPMAVQRRDIGLGRVELKLVPTGGNVDDLSVALAGEDGSFTFLGPGRGVKPGKYKLAVYHREQGPPGDSLNGAFSDDKTPMTVDVPAAKLGRELDLGAIDLDKAPATLP